MKNVRTFQTFAFPPSKEEYNELFLKDGGKLIPLILANCNKHALATRSSWYDYDDAMDDNCYYLTCILPDGTLSPIEATSQFYFPICCQVVFNPVSDIVTRVQTVSKSCKISNGHEVDSAMCLRMTKLMGEYPKSKTKIQGEGPIVHFAGMPFIWTNEQECYNGTDVAMKLWGYTILDTPCRFFTKEDIDTNMVEYIEALNAIYLCHNTITNNLSIEENESLISVEMDEHGNIIKPLYTEKQLKIMEEAKEMLKTLKQLKL